MSDHDLHRAAPPALAILGPTGTGKSALAIELATRFGGEIVSCDSTAVYRGFDIGTDKVPAAGRRGIPHHLIDVAEPSDVYTAARYGREASARELLARSAGRARQVDRRRTEARLDRWTGQPRASLAAWQTVAEAEPLDLDAHRTIAELLMQLDGPEAARAHLRAAVSRDPANVGVWRLLVEWLREDPTQCETSLAELPQMPPKPE